MFFSKYIPIWLFKPYVSKDQTLGDILFPIIVLVGMAFVSAIACFQVKGVLAGIIYTMLSFLLLCFLRYLLFCMVTRPRKEDGYVSTSLLGLGDLYSISLPCMVWTIVSLKIIAYYCWGWKMS